MVPSSNTTHFIHICVLNRQYLPLILFSFYSLQVKSKLSPLQISFRTKHHRPEVDKLRHTTATKPQIASSKIALFSMSHKENNTHLSSLLLLIKIHPANTLRRIFVRNQVNPTFIAIAHQMEEKKDPPTEVQ